MRRPVDYIRGSILLVSIMVMGTATLIGFLALSEASISRIVDADNTVKAFDMRMRVYGCMSEVLIQLSKDPAWSSATVDTGLTICDVTVTSPAPDERLLEIRDDNGTYHFGLDVIVDINTLDILDIDMAL